MKHYLMVVQALGKSDLTRVYVPLASEDETLAEAFDRWLDQAVAHRKRNVAKAREAVRASVIEKRLCRPTSWYRRNKLGAFAEPGTKPKRRRGR